MEDYVAIYNDSKEVQNLLSKSEKLDFIKKYNLSCSCKLKDIEHGILEIANELRKSSEKTLCQFTKTDYKIWNDYWGYPKTLNKLRDAIRGESQEFIKFLLSIFYESYIKTRHQSFKDNRYTILLKICEEESEHHKQSKEREEIIYENLTIITFDFKTKLYSRFISGEKKRFDFLSDYNTKTTQELTIIKTENPKLYSGFLQLKTRSKNFDWNIYKEYIDNEFESMFSNNIRNIASRINNNKEINIANLKLRAIHDDPKFFEMILCDGIRTIHCRSIIAAEHSNLVQTHYRFIVTVK